MANDAMNQVIGHLRRAALLADGAGPTDGKLLGSFIEGRDETAFEALVRRHGPMVLGVCRRFLRNQQDAEDAFQATFLVLVRKAGSVVPREMIGNWLYGVALQTAIRLRALNARRRWREKQVTVMPEAAAAAHECREDLQPMLDQELSRLPAKYRVAVVLCDLEGRTRKEAARQLGWPEGSVSSRLSRARALLARRLVKHGLVLSGEALVVFLSQNAASACPPAALVSATVKAATIIAAGQTAATTLVSTKVVAITKGVLTSMLLTKLKTAAVVSFIVCVLGIGVGASFLAGQTPGDNSQQPIGQTRGGAAKASAQGPATVAQKPDETRKLAELQTRRDEDIRVELQKLHTDIRLLKDQLISLQKELQIAAAEPKGKREIRMFSLRNLMADEVATTLEALFEPQNPNMVRRPQGAVAVARGGDTIRIVTFPSTNTVIVQAVPDVLESMATIIAKLETLPRHPEKQPDKK